MKKQILLCLLLLLAVVHADAKKIYSFGVRVTGHGRPMLLIPGLKGSADTYNDVVAHFKNRYTCYVITLAGFAGQPSSGAHDHLLQKQRDEIIQYMIDKNLKQPIIVGFSFGGKLAAWIATTRPDLAGPLIDIDGLTFEAALGTDNFNKDSLIMADEKKYASVVNETAAYWKSRDSIYHSPTEMKKGDARVWRLISDTARFNQITTWDIASDFRSATLMRIEADTVDLREAIAKLRNPVLILGSWVSWGYSSAEEAKKDYSDSWKKGRDVTIVFSKKGKHFLMYDDLNWMLSQMDAFLGRND